VSGSSTTVDDVFYVKKDTSSVQIIGYGAIGDDTWRNVPGTTYNVDFEAAGTSLLDTAQYTVWTGLNMTGSEIKTWTNIATDISSSSYTTDWTVDFSALQEDATNYVSIRVWNVTGTTTTVQDGFYVLKDVSLPSITDNQMGDDVWRSTNTAVYNVDFGDTGVRTMDHRFEAREIPEDWKRRRYAYPGLDRGG